MLFARKLFREVLILKIAARAQNSNNVNSILPGQIENNELLDRKRTRVLCKLRPGASCKRMLSQHVGDLFDAV
jgi:hypothetical protein